MIGRYDVMNKFNLEAPQFVFDCDFKRKLYTAFTFNICFLRLISTMGGENDLSASITQAFLVEEMSRDGTGSLLPFVKLPMISLFQNKNTSVIEKSRANAIFAFKVFERKELAMGV